MKNYCHKTPEMFILARHKAPTRDGSSVGPQAAYKFGISLHPANGQCFLCMFLLCVFILIKRKQPLTL